MTKYTKALSTLLATTAICMAAPVFAQDGWSGEASKSTYDFNELVSLYNNSEVIWSRSDTYLWNEIGVTAKLWENLAARVSYRVDHHTDVLPGTEKTDTITRFRIVYTVQ